MSTVERTPPSSPFSTGGIHDSLPIVRNTDGTITRIQPIPNAPTTPDPNSPSTVLTKDVPLNPQHNTWVRLFLPRRQALAASVKNSKLPLIVYVHGGGFILCSAASTFFHSFCADLAVASEAVVLSVDYRLAPEHRLPAAYDDVVDTLHWVRTSQDEWLRAFADISKCFIMGTSAGGNIAYHAALRAAEAVEDLLPLTIRGLILHEPAFGGSMKTESELKSADDPILPQFVLDQVWELTLPIGADLDHEYCNPMVTDEGAHQWEKIRMLGWRVIVAGCKGDPMSGRQMELGEALQKKGLDVLTHFDEGDYHGVLIREPSKAEAFFVIVRDFVHASSFN